MLVGRTFTSTEKVLKLKVNGAEESTRTVSTVGLIVILPTRLSVWVTPLMVNGSEKLKS